jgi:hypothetical protein
MNKIKKKLLKNINAYSQQRYFNKHLTEAEKNEINRFPGITIGEKIYNFIYDNHEKHYCKKCKKELKFKSFKMGYNTYCSSACSAKQRIKSKESIQKMLNTYKQTMLSKYGVENSFQLDKVIKDIKNRDEDFYKRRKEKTVITNREKYNCDWANQNTDIQNKRKNTNMIKYGNNCSLHGPYGILTLNPDLLKTHSNIESQVVDFIKSVFSYIIIENSRKIITPLELDIYLPEINLGIEINGVYWHSLHQSDQYKKLYICNEKNINLIQIYDLEWEKQKNIIQNLLTSFIFGKSYNIEDYKYITYEKNNLVYHNNYWPIPDNFKKYVIGYTDREKYFPYPNDRDKYIIDCGYSIIQKTVK